MILIWPSQGDAEGWFRSDTVRYC